MYRGYVLTSPATFELDPPSAHEMQTRILSTMELYPWLVFETNRTIAGYAYASRHRDRPAYRWAVDCSAYIAPEFHRQGIGRRLYEQLFSILKRQGFTNVFAGITLPNDASVGLHQAMGFQLVGEYKNVGFKLGRWHDTSWWQLPLAPTQNPPEEPLNWRDLVPELLSTAPTR
jgi:phosphinothricin acetyltransferase